MFQAMKDYWWLLLLRGIVAVLFGIYGFRFPADGALAIVYAIGFYAIFIGAMYIIGSFQVRRVGNELTPSTVKAV